MNKDKIYWAKVKEDAIIPTRDEENGCYDVYACFEEDFIEIEPNEIKMIPTGIASAFPKTYRVGLRERGSTGTIGMSYRSGQIDSGYRGEWFVPINNTTNKTIVILKGLDKRYKMDSVTIYPYTKAICQAALEFVPQVDEQKISYEELQKIDSKRGKTCLGASGK